MEITNEQVAWLAGYLEGEGTFVLTKTKTPRIQIGIDSKDIEILYEIKNVFGGKVYGPYQKPNGKAVAFWYISGKSNFMRIVKLVYPWMFSRRKNRIDEIIEEINASNN